MSKPMSFWERVAAGAVGSFAGAIIGTILLGPAGTAIGAKVGGTCGGGCGG